MEYTPSWLPTGQAKPAHTARLQTTETIINQYRGVSATVNVYSHFCVRHLSGK